MINKTLALIVIFSLAFNIAFVGIWAYTRVRPAPQRPAPARPVAPPAPAADGLWQQLGLTPEQQRSVVEEWRQVGHQVEGKQAEVRAQRARLIDLLQADVLDEQALRATRDKMDEDQQAVRELVFNRMLQLRQVLNPEQRRRWLEVMLRTSEAAGGAKGPGPANGPQAAQNAGARVTTQGPRADGPGPEPRPE
jgi:Spy/CpxP family protein refolding chaperone